MPTTYEPVPSEVNSFAKTVLRTHHPDLYAAELDIQYIFAVNTKDWAIKVRGQRALAKVKIVNLEDRVRGGPDAKITIDKEWWEGHGDDERAALLDHEHEHLELTKMRRTEEGDLVFDTDDAGRPKLKMKNHDIELGVFLNVVKRHEEKAADFQVVRKAAKAVSELVQQKFWG